MQAARFDSRRLDPRRKTKMKADTLALHKIFDGERRIAGLALIAPITEKEFEGGRAISAIPVTLDGDRCNPFQVSPNFPAFNAFTKLRYLTLVRDLHCSPLRTLVAAPVRIPRSTRCS
jgi:hypothetical protein